MAQSQKVSDTVLAAVERPAEEYVAEIEASAYTASSKNTRIANIKRLVRWLRCGYEVGAGSITP